MSRAENPAKAFLKDYKFKKDELAVKENQVEELKTLLGLSGMDLGERVQSSPDPSKTSDKIVNLAELTTELEACRTSALKSFKKVQRVINSLDSNPYRAILTARYLSCKQWDDIAEELNYEIRYLYKLHGKALIEVENILEKDSKRH